MKDQFDLDDLFETKLDELSGEHPQPQAMSEKPMAAVTGASQVEIRYVDARQRSKSDTPLFWGLGFSLGLVFLGIVIGFNIPRKTGGNVVEPDTDPVNGAYVAIFYNDLDLDKYTKSQSDFIKSAITASWLDEHKVNWKKIDTDPLDVSNLEKPFQVMAEKHRSKEPWIVIATGKKFASEPIDSNEQAMKLLQKWIK